jgi:diadenosine tetraphosphate (Ap4A) HIT family hydrolase
MRFDGPAGPPPIDGSCPFCDPATVATALTTTEHFYLLADNAPLVEGHALLIPRDHYACYGALPAAWDDELLTLKGRVERFEIERYRPATLFEHGVFGQSVYHAHLHAVPLGPSGLDMPALAASAEGRMVTELADVRDWWETRGQYFYLESPLDHSETTEAAIFPPREGPYVRVLTMLRERSHIYNPWQPQFVRRMNGDDKVRALAAQWASFAAREG